MEHSVQTQIKQSAIWYTGFSTLRARALPLPRAHLHLVAPEEGGCGLGSGLRLRAVLAHHVQDHAVVLGVIPRAHGQRCAQAYRPANPAGAATHSANLLDRFQWKMSRATDDLKWGGGQIQKFEIFVFSLIYPDVWTRLCATARWCLQPPSDSPGFGGRRKKNNPTIDSSKSRRGLLTSPGLTPPLLYRMIVLRQNSPCCGGVMFHAAPETPCDYCTLGWKRTHVYPAALLMLRASCGQCALRMTRTRGEAHQIKTASQDADMRHFFYPFA